MTQLHWLNPVSDSFTNAADWSGGMVPGAADDAILDAPGATRYTVTASASETVHSIQTAATATLSITGGTFTALDGTGAGANAGIVAVANGAHLTITGPISNTGAIALSGANTSLLLAGGATLSGGGTVSLDYPTEHIVGTDGGAVLTNVDNTISGIGIIGGHLTIINEAKGVIDGANLTIDTAGATLVNSGLLEAGFGTLQITGTTVDQSSGGLIFGGPGSEVILNNTDVIGGTLRGFIITQRGSTNSLLDGSSSAVSLDGSLSVIASNLTVQGTIMLSTGTLRLGQGLFGGELIIGAQRATLIGGEVTAGSSASSVIGTLSGSGSNQTVSTLINRSTISGGTVGSNLSLINDGHVENCVLHTGNVGVAGSNVVTNNGLLENLTLQSVVIADTPGKGRIVASGGNVILQNATVQGGSLVAAPGSAIETAVNDLTSLIDGTASAVSLRGALNVNDNTHLTAQGTLDNAGMIALLAAGNDTRLVVGAPGLTLTGGGKVTLTDDVANTIIGVSSAATLTNVDNLISGAGNLGDRSMTLINQAAGVIAATGANLLILDTYRNTIENAGLIEATAGGVGAIRSAVDNTGVLEAAGGVLTVNAAVTGAGAGVISAGRLRFASSFSENVAFTGASGVLDVAKSQTYAGAVSGFSKTGGTSFDLRDIAFVSAGEAMFSGTATSGGLTVTDGTHTAHITLIGDYTGSTFTASSDGHGGTSIVDPAKGRAVATPPHTFISAMAGLGGSAGGAIHAHQAWSVAEPILLKPRTMIA